MSVTVDEMRIGRKTDLKKAERQYVIKGAGDEGTALAYLLSSAAGTVNGMPISRPDCSVEEIGTNLFVGTAGYAPPDGKSQPPNSFSITFDISGQTTHITNSKETRARYRPTGQPLRDFKGAINVDEDGTVNGVDIVTPQTVFTLNYTTDPANITDSYVALLGRIVGSVNDADFKGYNKGELLLTRVSGQQRDSEAWDLSFGFSVSENKSDFLVGTDITVTFKYGWDFLWVYYVTKNDTTNHVLLKVPAQASIERVYEYKDFTTLGLP